MARRNGTAVAAIVAAAVMALAAGCTAPSPSDQGADTTAPAAAQPPAPTTTRQSSFDRWATAVRSICDTYAPQALVVMQSLGIPENEDELVVLIEALLPIYQAHLDEMLAVGPPVERRREVDRVLELAEGQVRVLGRLRNTVVAGNRGLMGLAAQDLDRQFYELDRRLAALGLDDCGAGLLGMS